MDEDKGLLKFEFPNVPKLDFASEVAEINKQVQEIAKSLQKCVCK